MIIYRKLFLIFLLACVNCEISGHAGMSKEAEPHSVAEQLPEESGDLKAACDVECIACEVFGGAAGGAAAVSCCIQSGFVAGGWCCLGTAGGVVACEVTRRCIKNRYGHAR